MPSNWLTAKTKAPKGSLIATIEEINRPRPQYPEPQLVLPSPVQPRNVDGINGTAIPLKISVDEIPLKGCRLDPFCLRLVANHFDTTPEEMLGYLRTHSVIDARKVYCLVMRNNFHWSLCRIGRSLHRDHSTVFYHVKRSTFAHHHVAALVRQELVEKGLL